ncbi:MAG: recombinase RecA [Defluviitaleaceae bacterium]|nr:recombinase RecA [Defluviitaleaceae bacterium]
MNEDRQKALETALAKIEKDFGKGSVMKMGEAVKNMGIDTIPSGSLSLDIALGLGGFPRGRIIEIYGPESSGKTTVTLHLIAEAQKMGGVVAFIDAEHALDPVYARNLGVNIDELYVAQPDDGEQALDIAEEMVRSAAIDVIVVDSVAALVPRAEIEGDMGDSHMGLHARLMSQALRKLTAIANKNNCLIIFTNQLREKIGVMFGSPETTTGGRALKFYASVRLDIRKGEAIKVGDKHLGNRTKVKVVKNKVAPPFRTCEFDIVFGEGISKVGDVLDLATSIDIVAKSGSWFSYGEERLGQGREKAKDTLASRPELLVEIETAVREHFGLKAKDESSLSERTFDDVKKKPEKSAKKPSKKSKEKEEEIVGTIDLDDAEIDNIIEELGLVAEDEK